MNKGPCPSRIRKNSIYLAIVLPIINIISYIQHKVLSRLVARHTNMAVTTSSLGRSNKSSGQIYEASGTMCPFVANADGQQGHVPALFLIIQVQP